jgi:hypothetical protein
MARHDKYKYELIAFMLHKTLQCWLLYFIIIMPFNRIATFTLLKHHGTLFGWENSDVW